MANGNGNVQVDQNNPKTVQGEVKKFDEKKPFPEGIFGGDGIKKPLKETEEKKQGKVASANIEEIVKYLKDMTSLGDKETELFKELVKKCFSANRSDLIKKIDETHKGTNVEYKQVLGNGSVERKNVPYENYIIKVLNELIGEKEKTPEIRNIFNAVNSYNMEMVTKLGSYNASKILYRMHLETEEGREFMKKCDHDLANDMLNQYYLEVLKNMDINEIIIEKKE